MFVCISWSKVSKDYDTPENDCHIEQQVVEELPFLIQDYPLKKATISYNSFESLIILLLYNIIIIMNTFFSFCLNSNFLSEYRLGHVRDFNIWADVTETGPLSYFVYDKNATWWLKFDSFI